MWTDTECSSQIKSDGFFLFVFFFVTIREMNGKQPLIILALLKTDKRSGMLSPFHQRSFETAETK